MLMLLCAAFAQSAVDRGHPLAPIEHAAGNDWVAMAWGSILVIAATLLALALDREMVRRAARREQQSKDAP